MRALFFLVLVSPVLAAFERRYLPRVANWVYGGRNLDNREATGRLVSEPRKEKGNSSHDRKF